MLEEGFVHTARTVRYVMVKQHFFVKSVRNFKGGSDI